MKGYVIFSLSANKKLASELADFLNAPLGKIASTNFADGEVMVKTETNVNGKDVVLIESTSQRAQEKLFELLLLIDSFHRAGARSVNLFIPYFGYSRQERSYANEPVSCQVAAQVLETANYDELSCVDLHHPIIETFFTKPINNLSTSDLFINYYLNYLNVNNISKNDAVIVAPDHGSNTRIENVVSGLGIRKVILDKVRPSADVAEHLEINEDVTGKTCIIIDDIVDTGNTLVSAAKLLYQHGAKSVLIAATHAVLSGDCLRKLKDADIKDIVVTNSIEQDLPVGVNVLDIMPIILKKIQ